LALIEGAGGKQVILSLDGHFEKMPIRLPWVRVKKRLQCFWHYEMVETMIFRDAFKTDWVSSFLKAGG